MGNGKVLMRVYCLARAGLITSNKQAMTDREDCGSYSSTSPRGVLFMHNLYSTEKIFSHRSTLHHDFHTSSCFPNKLFQTVVQTVPPSSFLTCLILRPNFLQLLQSSTLLTPSTVSQSSQCDIHLVPSLRGTLFPNHTNSLVRFLAVLETALIPLAFPQNNHRHNSHNPQPFPYPQCPRPNIQRCSVEDMKPSRII